MTTLNSNHQKTVHFEKHTLSTRGFSLVEVLVALGLAGVLMMVILNSITHQNNELRSTDEKMSIQSTQMLITNVLTNPTFCGCFIGAQTFNYTTKAWNGFPTSIDSSYNLACAPQGGALLTVGTKIPGTSLVPTAMNFQNITETIVGSGNFTANLSVQFDQGQLTRARKNISIPMTFRVRMTDPIATRGLDSCSASGGGGGGGGGGLDMPTVCAQLGGIYNASATPPCQVTYQ